MLTPAKGPHIVSDSHMTGVPTRISHNALIRYRRQIDRQLLRGSTAVSVGSLDQPERQGRDLGKRADALMWPGQPWCPGGAARRGGQVLVCHNPAQRGRRGSQVNRPSAVVDRGPTGNRVPAGSGPRPTWTPRPSCGWTAGPDGPTALPLSMTCARSRSAPLARQAGSAGQGARLWV